jgi:iron complex outermembrane recepter protein
VRKLFFVAWLMTCVVALGTTALAEETTKGSASPAQATGGSAQPAAGDAGTDQSPDRTVKAEVTVTAPRVEIPLKESPAATSVVTPEDLEKTMPKGIGAEEALRFVPGVQVDNQADGERVHISIRGQGLLTERGIRGIKVLLDGLPLNDPTGFAPDLYDVDWSTVSNLEVFRGPSSALYGGGAAGGVINISTKDGGPKKISSDLMGEVGSYGFWKALGEVDGTDGDLNYRVSASRNFGDGWREHTAFHATNLYGKFRLTPSENVTITTIVAGTSFFNENAEGLNLAQLEEDPRQPNPDAITYNERQITSRGTVGVHGEIKLASNQDLGFSLYYRHTMFEEAVPSAVDHRTLDTPGGIFQYNVHLGSGTVKNHISVGVDLDGQTIAEYKRPNTGGANEGALVLADQTIEQGSVGVWALDRVELSKEWSLFLDARSDNISNKLTDNLKLGGVDLSGDASFDKVTGRVGAAWNPRPDFGMYASWGQGFLPPATEELANNPAHQGGFNEGLVPATSVGEEVGARGALPGQLTYDVAVFHLTTENDFGRYRVPGRPLETFYQNAGSTRRWGLETSLGWYPVNNLSVRLAYTYQDYKYDQVSSLFGNYKDTYMPNSPKHEAYLDAEYKVASHWVFGVGVDARSSWYIDPSNETSQDGYTLVNPRIGFRWAGTGYRGEVMVTARNVFSENYVAFTEPDPDGNSYQPGPTRELYLGARIWFGE